MRCFKTVAIRLLIAIIHFIDRMKLEFLREINSLKLKLLIVYVYSNLLVPDKWSSEIEVNSFDLQTKCL